MADVFNNSSNNYSHPALSPCAGTADDTFLEFLPNKSIGLIKGAQIITSIDFSDLKIPVSAYSNQTKILNPGEVDFIPGLTKGLQNRKQVFLFPPLPQNDLNNYFMEIDISISFYKNFKYTTLSIESSSNYGENIDINTALSISLSNNGIKAMSESDPSSLIFTGTQEGYDFNVSSVLLTLIDSSQNSLSPFSPVIDPSSGDRIPQTWTLVENKDAEVLYAKYPNSAMQGIILKGTYPESDSICDADKWIKINHVGDYITLYEPLQIDSSTFYEQKIKSIDVGLSGESTETTISAGDYLDWIETNEYWDKVGELYSRISSIDYGTSKNLVEGFYVFNPHDFDVKIEYLLFV